MAVEPTTELVRSLSGDLSSAVDLETWSNATALLTTTKAPTQDFACISSGCLLLYTQQLSYPTPQTFLYGTRVDASGALQDGPRVYFGAATAVSSLIARTSDYIAVWTVPNGTGGTQARAWRLSGTTGQMVEDVGAILPTGTNHRLFRGDSTMVVLYDNNGTSYTQLVDLATLAAIGTPRAHASRPSAIAAGGGVYLVAWSEVFQRFSQATGLAIDAQPILYTQFWPGKPQAVFSDGNFQLVWVNQNNVYGARIRASDGVVLDADTATTPGADVLCSNCFSDVVCPGAQAASMNLARANTNVVVTWRAISSTNGECRHGGLSGRRIDPANGQSNATFTRNATTADAVSHAVKTSPGGTMYMIDGVNVTPLTVAGSAGYALLPGTARPYPRELASRTRAVAVRGQSGYLALWASTAAGPLRGLRLGTTAGQLVDSAPIDLSAPSGQYSVVNAAADGNNYLVAWGGSAIGRRFLQANGTVGAVLPTPLPASSTSNTLSLQDLSLIRSGTGFLLGYGQNDITAGMLTSRFLRLTQTGNAADAATSQVQSLSCSNCTSTAAASAALDPRNITPAGYLLFSAIGGSARLSSLPVTADAAATTSAAFTIGANPLFVTGTDNAALFTGPSGAGGSQGTQGRVFDPATLNSRAGDPVTLDLCAGCRVRDAWFDGGTYLLLIEDAPMSRLFLRAYNRDLTPEIDTAAPSEVTITNSFGAAADASRLAVGASDKQGNSVIVYQERTPAVSGTTLRARWFHHVPGTGGAGGSGGSGGSGGAGGGAGTGGSGGAGGSTGGSGGSGGTGGTGGASGGTGGTGGAAGAGGSSGGAGGTTGGAGGTGGSAGAIGSGGAGGATGGTAGGAGGSGGAGGTTGGSGGSAAGAGGSGGGGGAAGAGGRGGGGGGGASGAGGTAGAGGAAGSGGAAGTAGGGGTTGGAGGSAGTTGRGGTTGAGGTAGGGGYGGAAGSTAGGGGSSAGGRGGATGGSGGSGGSTPSGGDNGCGCAVAPDQAAASLVLPMAAFMTAFLRRRRRR